MGDSTNPGYWATAATASIASGLYAGIKKMNKFYSSAEFKLAKGVSLFRTAHNVEINKILKQNNAILKSSTAGLGVSAGVFGITLLLDYLKKE